MGARSPTLHHDATPHTSLSRQQLPARQQAEEGRREKEREKDKAREEKKDEREALAWSSERVKMPMERAAAGARSCTPGVRAAWCEGCLV